ncbi:hypothetical protein KKA39_03390 [Patescibacteria group bacterium]|nr:hypothetical protein [Patescibacteria group bacterium]
MEKRDLLMATNRRLQETAQKLFMAKQELEEKNKELEKAKEIEKHEKEHLQKELDALNRLARMPDAQAGPRVKEKAEPAIEKKLTKDIAEDLSLRYIHILESYVRTKDLDKDESLTEELCLKLIECGVTPKGIISIHLKAVPQIKTIGDLETRRITFESRMVLLKVMTTYADLLRCKG